MRRHITVPVFVPHEGCPHDCYFCNQRAISGTVQSPTPEQVTKLLWQVRESLGERMQEAELAFFGGSFTAINSGYRKALLEAAAPFVGSGGFAGIRISTRPDCIDSTVLNELKAAGVTVIELGVQSMSDTVLVANNRGHTAENTVVASRLIQTHGFQLGHQMMTGLYGSGPEMDLETGYKIAAMKPDMVRIYPTVVLRGTRLETLWKSGGYRPQTVEQAVALGAELLQLFSQRNIPVIRLGLHDEAGLQSGILAGPHHPALRELCENKLMLDSVLAQLQSANISPGPVRLGVHPRSLSKLIGQNRSNFVLLEQMGYTPKAAQDNALEPLEVRVEP